MYLCSLIVIPLIGIAIVSSVKTWFKEISLSIAIFNLVISLIIFIMFNNSDNQFQFVLEQYNVSTYDLYLGIDGISLYFVLLTTIIIPISVLSN
jgi:NADH-ubiquinone oxidoreductase chain 4